MIKIFSIKEIVEATEKILSSSDQNQNKNNKVSNLNNKKKNKTDHSKSFEEPLILEIELENSNELTNNKHLEINEQQNSKVITAGENNTDREEIINELYKLFNKKIKRSTLKIIIEQQKEIKELKLKLSELRKKDYQSLRVNKELKNKIYDLVNKKDLQGRSNRSPQ